MSSVAAIRELNSLAVQQWGFVTSAQALSRGISRVAISRLTSAGVLRSVVRGVYEFLDSVVVANEDMYALWLSLESETPPAERSRVPQDGAGVFAGVAAARIHGIGDLSVTEYEIVLPKRRQTRHEHVCFRREALPSSEATVVDGLPVLTVPRLIKDFLERDYPVDVSLISDLISEAVSKKLITMEELEVLLRTVSEEDRAFYLEEARERADGFSYV